MPDSKREVREIILGLDSKFLSLPPFTLIFLLIFTTCKVTGDEYEGVEKMLKAHPELHNALRKRGITDMDLVMVRTCVSPSNWTHFLIQIFVIRAD